MGYENTKFVLSFEGSTPELRWSTFIHPELEHPVQSVYGHPLDKGGSCTFPRTRGVQALSLMALESVVNRRCSLKMFSPLVGYSGSFAAALSNALEDRRYWLEDMFGFDAHGNALAKRVLKRTIARNGKGTLITVDFNKELIPDACLEILFQGRRVHDLTVLTKLRNALKRLDSKGSDVFELFEGVMHAA